MKGMINCAGLACVSLALFSVQSYSAPRNAISEEQISEQVSELSFEDLDTVTTDELIRLGKESTRQRDTLRTLKELNQLEEDTYSSSLDKFKAKRSAKAIEFITDNVPAKILALGDKEVANYIQVNFIDSEKPKATVAKSTWTNSNNALTKPIEHNVEWSTTISQPTEVTPAESPDEPTVDVVAQDDPLSETESLNALGITQGELEAMFGVGDTIAPQPPSETVAIDNSASVQNSRALIEDISINRLVVMGRTRQVSADISFNIIRDQKSRKIKKEFFEISPGYIFQIEDDKFELVSVDETSVVFENINTKTTFRELVN